MKEFLFVIILLSVLFLMLNSCVESRYEARCAESWPSRTAEYTSFVGCLVEHKGEMVPSENIRLD